MNIESKIMHESKAAPGVRFTVKRLNVMERAARDFVIAEEKIKYSRLLAEQRSLLARECPGFAAEEDAGKRRAMIEAMSESASAELTELQFRASLIFERTVRPGVIGAGLVSIEGLSADGVPVTVQNFAACATDELLIEVYEACEAAAGLSDEQRKN
jgi:hypothetical protein